MREATDLFMADERAQGIGVGIGYFGKQTFGAGQLRPGDYEAAAVEVGLLPDYAAAIMDSLNEEGADR